LGRQDEYPFTQAVHGEMFRKQLWTMRQYAGYASAKESNERYRYLVPTGNATTSTPAKHAYVVEIQPPDGKPFRVEIDDPMIRTLSYRGAQIGETVAVLVDFKREKAKLETHDAARGDDPFASGRASNERFAASLAGTKPGAPDASARVDMVATLRMLDAQVASGSITQEQYRAARRKQFTRPPACRARSRSPALATTALP
jgi:hypothetical protein